MEKSCFSEDGEGNVTVIYKGLQGFDIIWFLVSLRLFIIWICES